MDNFNSGIYYIENIQTNKKYIGQSVDINKRWKSHLQRLRLNKHTNRHLQSAFNKYGEDNFKFEILLICEPFELTRYEQFFVDYYTPELLYNICVDCVDSTLGVCHTTEDKIKMSNAFSDERKIEYSKRMLGESNPMYGKNHSDEFKIRMSKRMSGKNNPRYGNVVSIETRDKISNAIKGENHPKSKLLEKDVLEIKCLLRENNLSHKSIAEIYNVSPETISSIKNGRSWKHLYDKFRKEENEQ